MNRPRAFHCCNLEDEKKNKTFVVHYHESNAGDYANKI